MAEVFVSGPGEGTLAGRGPIEMNDAMASEPPDTERLREACARYESYPA